jgi:hypothetical protein
MLHLVNERQFDAVAFELNGDSHFLAGITAADVRGSAANAAGRA